MNGYYSQMIWSYTQKKNYTYVINLAILLEINIIVQNQFYVHTKAINN